MQSPADKPQRQAAGRGLLLGPGLCRPAGSSGTRSGRSGPSAGKRTPRSLSDFKVESGASCNCSQKQAAVGRWAKPGVPRRELRQGLPPAAPGSAVAGAKGRVCGICRVFTCGSGRLGEGGSRGRGQGATGQWGEGIQPTAKYPLESGGGGGRGESSKRHSNDKPWSWPEPPRDNWGCRIRTEGQEDADGGRSRPGRLSLSALREATLPPRAARLRHLLDVRPHNQCA